MKAESRSRQVIWHQKSWDQEFQANFAFLCLHYTQALLIIMNVYFNHYLWIAQLVFIETWLLAKPMENREEGKEKVRGERITWHKGIPLFHQVCYLESPLLQGFCSLFQIVLEWWKPSIFFPPKWHGTLCWIHH